MHHNGGLSIAAPVQVRDRQPHRRAVLGLGRRIVHTARPAARYAMPQRLVVAGLRAAT